MHVTKEDDINEYATKEDDIKWYDIKRYDITEYLLIKWADYVSTAYRTISRKLNEQDIEDLYF